MKQWDMAQKYSHDPRVVFMIGDVRDRERLARALDGIDYVAMLRLRKLFLRLNTIHLSVSKLILMVQ
jgi:hypothetical protein